MKELLLNHNKPIYTCEADARCKSLVEYPVHEIVKATNCHYLNNTVAYAVAFAYWNDVANVKLFGIDFTYKNNLHFAEQGRACVEFWCAVGITKGVKIQVSQNSSLLDSNVPENEKLYGYHRLDDPLVQRFSEEGLMIVPQTSLSSPEPEEFTKTQQTEGVLIGRHDIEGVTYRANGRA